MSNISGCYDNGKIVVNLFAKMEPIYRSVFSSSIGGEVMGLSVWKGGIVILPAESFPLLDENLV